MFGSRGKGNRRVPWRDGGAKKMTAAVWPKQAHHAVNKVEELGTPIVSLTYHGEWGETGATKIYKFDQKIAKTGIPYHAEYLGWWHGFTIQVHEEHKQQVQEIIDKI